ncbi:MAG TPA: acetylxylan esterase [Opitutus sp.]|nr:acetylxylan esterase [Opitutus sp.]
MSPTLRLLVLSSLMVMPLAPGRADDAKPAAAKAAAPKPPWLLSPEERARLNKLIDEDHADMMRQLGITKLRPGRNGNTAPGQTNQANYDEAKANPFPDWPDVLTCNDGTKITTPELWWKKRRPEIFEDFEREVYGRIPDDVPGVKWSVGETVNTKVGDHPVVARRLVGHVDNSGDLAITVNIRGALVLPANATKPVPVLVMFSWGAMPDDPVPHFPGFPTPPGPSSEEQLIAAGWGYVSLNTTSIQADNGAGLTEGIIGLTNHGKRRTPEQWGSLRAWGWGAGRVLDYLETLPEVDAKHVGIEGVSRYGKAALVTMAFNQRFAFVLVGSSGKGGATALRRSYGEAVENLTSSYSYHWMAGNFMKYGEEEGTHGTMNAGMLPVDSHELIALCAPRLTFISYGVPAKGDAHWLDHQGSFMATVAAQPVFRLLGAHGLGVPDDYHTAKMPPPLSDLLDGELAWRQHTGGHEDRSNMTNFINWVDSKIGYHTPAVTDVN